jgi:hypothetical protein
VCVGEWAVEVSKYKESSIFRPNNAGNYLRSL